jgi:hypothetical protein
MPTNPYYQQAFTGSAGQTARAEAVTTEYESVQAGFDGVWAAVQQAIHSGTAGEILTTLPNAASRINKYLKFDASGNPIVVSSPLNVRGMWAASTAYAVGDAYNSTPNGSLYFVQIAYTSGATFGATDLANTEVIVNLSGLLFTDPTVVTGPTTQAMVAGNTYGTDSRAGNIVLNLPTASVGDSPVNVTYLAGTLTGSQLVTINVASGQFFGLAANNITQITLDITQANFSMQYWGATFGWQLRTMG